MRLVLGHDKEGAKNTILLVHTIVPEFGPDVDSIDSYLDNGVDFAYVNGTATIGLTVGNLKLPLITAPATQSLRYDTSTCLAYEAVGTVEPVDGVLQTVLTALSLQNLDLAPIVDSL